MNEWFILILQMRGLWQRKAMSNYTGSPSLLSPSSIDRWEGVRAGNFKYPRVYQWGIWAWRWRVTYSVSWREELDEDPGYWPSVWGTELLLPAPSPWTWALTIKLVWTNPYLLLNDTSLVAWGQRGGSDGPKRGTRDLLGWWKYSVSECGSGFMVHAPPNSSSCTLRMDCALNWNYISVKVIKKSQCVYLGLVFPNQAFLLWAVWWG